MHRLAAEWEPVRKNDSQTDFSQEGVLVESQSHSKAFSRTHTHIIPARGHIPNQGHANIYTHIHTHGGVLV